MYFCNVSSCIFSGNQSCLFTTIRHPGFFSIYPSVYLIFIYFLLTQTYHAHTHSLWGQFHQHSLRSFYIRKLRAQIFCAYILGLCFTGVSLPAQKLRIEC
jgi:hypothetical protein